MAASDDKIDALERSNYCSLATRKHSGDYVATPVWFAPGEGGYYVFSAGAAGKVKRLRNYSECRLAPCTARGGVTGEWLEAQGELLSDEQGQQQALKALHAKYGWQMSMADVMSKLGGKYHKRCYLRVEINDRPE